MTQKITKNRVNLRKVTRLDDRVIFLKKMEMTKCFDLAAREDFYFVSDDWWLFNETGRSVGCTATAIFRPKGKGSRINQKKKNGKK